MPVASRTRHFLGRASPDSAIRGGSYGGVANEMDGAKLAIKQRRPTIENALQMSRDRASLRPLDTFYGQLSMDLSKSEDAEIKALASRVLQFWQAAQRNLMSRVGPVIQYIEDYRTDYRGRGLPVIYDPEIGNRAMWAESTGIGGSGFIGGGTPLSELGGALSGARDKGDAASVSGSSMSSQALSMAGTLKEVQSAQAAQRERQDLFEKQMAELMEGVKAIQRSVGQIQSDKNFYRDATCNICKKKGHIAKDCTEKKKEE